MTNHNYNEIRQYKGAAHPDISVGNVICPATRCQARYVWNAVIKTHQIPRIACDTAICRAGSLVSFSRSDSTWRWRSTFENRSDAEVVGASIWREVLVKEPHINDDD